MGFFMLAAFAITACLTVIPALWVAGRIYTGEGC